MANPIPTYTKSSNFSGATGKTSDKNKIAPLLDKNAKKSPIKKESMISPQEKFAEKAEKVVVNPFFIVPADETLEKDKNDLKEQTLSSWAHSGGLPAKSGIVLEHTMLIQNNEIS